MQCDYFDAGVCRSCRLMGQDYAEQLRRKQTTVAQVLAPWVEDPQWAPAVASRESGFRNKAKLVVGGRKGAPTVGILDTEARGVDLRHCGLYEPGLHRAVLDLADRLPTSGLTPYDVPTRQGELKHVLLTHSPDGDLMARFVLRSPGQRRRVEDLLTTLCDSADTPRLTVASLNLHPEHTALLEGPQEELLTEESTLAMAVGTLRLHLGLRSFFQTNTPVATELYRQVTEWVREIGPTAVWDLYCGVGGFALHLAAPGRAVTGVEVSDEAIRSALRTRAELPVEHAAGLSFVAADATRYALTSDPRSRPDLAVVNPPRRGIGEELAGWLDTSGISHVVYSSCSAASLARDLARMPAYQVVAARLFDMFPQTDHHEVAVLLSRR